MPAEGKLNIAAHTEDEPSHSEGPYHSHWKREPQCLSNVKHKFPGNAFVVEHLVLLPFTRYTRVVLEKTDER